MKSSSQSPIGIGLIGFGNIGTGVVHWLRSNAEVIQSRLPRPVRLVRIADIDIGRDRGIPMEPGMLTTDVDGLIADPDISIIIELIGGVDRARRIVEKSLRAGKHVVTANKALLATHGAELFALAREKGLVIGAEASVGAGIPVIRAMHQSLEPNRFTRVAGIVNGTCNYILTEMERTGKPFGEVLAEAQKLGYAEPDPTFDIEGIDTAHKIAVLASLAFGMDIRIGDVRVEGISRLKPAHLDWAKKQGRRIKLLAQGRRAGNDSVEVIVAPTLVSAAGQIGSVGGVYNAVVFEGEPIGRTMVYGRGAGQESTASGVLSDVMAIAAAIECGGLAREMMLPWPKDEKKLLDAADSTGEFVLPIETTDAPGVLASLVEAMERAKLPASRWEALPAVGTPTGLKGSGYLVWVETAKTPNQRIQAALDDLESRGVLRERPQVLRVEREF